MKRRWTPAVVVALALPGGASGTSSCHQHVELLGVTAAPATVWVAIDRDGECHSSFLVQVATTGDAELVTHGASYGEWAWARCAIDGAWTYAHLDLDVDDGVWSAPGLGVRVEAPAANDSLLAAFHAHVREGGSNGATWLAATGAAGIQPPLVTMHGFLIVDDPW